MPARVSPLVRCGLLFSFLLSVLFCMQSRLAAQDEWRVGLAKQKISPEGKVRLSGYGNRAKPTDVHRTDLFVRCAAIASGTDGKTSDTHLLIAVDNIGIPAELSKTICDAIEDQHNIVRSHVAISSTHTHCAPALNLQLSNIFSEPLTEAERATSLAYRKRLESGVLACVEKAINALAPAKLSYTRGSVDFAVNRRLLKENRWSGFGVQDGGVVDHSVPLIAVEDLNGNLRGMIFNYACHCTSIDPSINEVNYDWAGYACAKLEERFPEAVAVCTIGCGADQNPSPRGETALAEAHGAKLAKEVTRLLDTERRPLNGKIDAKFDYAALSFDLPTIEEVRMNLTHSTPQVRRRAAHLNEVYKRDGRLPATYPVPIQSWRIGDNLTMVFLGGEVVVDYTLRLRRELNDPELWVTAYANDVMGYVCSERMRIEGGYEYDSSAVYYNLPGPWAGGTEDFLIDRVTTMVRSKGRPEPVDTSQVLDTFEIADGYKIELVASEPLVIDPINIAFGVDGRLWVVEMGDYPEGLEDGAKGGRIKYLTDSDGDGRYDKATTFLEQLEFPTGVFPWGKGVIISAAPEIFYAEDTNHDGIADKRETLFSGFVLANPQHRINGFTYGLDHSLYCASGDNLGDILSTKLGQTVNASGRDIKVFPDSGIIELVSGRSQFIRSRNVWGEWFGNDNSRPLYQYVIDARYSDRKGAEGLRLSPQQLFSPAVAPPVIPASKTVERFNDLFAANRFTSACSPIILSGSDQIDGNDVALICEPVHNLVHRAVLQPSGATYKAVRANADEGQEFLASRDPWFRPVRVLQGPDGGIWIADMYRESIEHPEWIPEAWQKQLNLRAGENRGRIYRVVGPATDDKQVVSLKNLSALQLVSKLKDARAALRDLAHQQLLEETSGRPNAETLQAVESLLLDSKLPEARVHALHLLKVWNKLKPTHLITVVDLVEDPQSSGSLTRSTTARNHGDVLTAIELSEPLLQSDHHDSLLNALLAATKSDDPRVLMRIALALGETSNKRAGEGLATICIQPNIDNWVATAIETSLHRHAKPVAEQLIAMLRSEPSRFGDIHERLLSRALKTIAGVDPTVGRLVESVLAEADGEEWGLRFASIAAETIRITQSSASSDQKSLTNAKSELGKLYDQALSMVSDSQVAADQRCKAMTLLGIGLGSVEEESKLLLDLMTVNVPVEVQTEALEKLVSLRQPQLADRLLERWATLSTGIRGQCVAKMLTTGPWLESLVAALESGAIRVNDLSLADRQQLRLSGGRSLQVRVDRILGNGGSLAKRRLVEEYLSAISGNVNQANGEKLFAQHCAVCHISKDGGQAVGASLSNLTNLTSRFLVESILDPNRAVDPKYQNFVILTEDGRTLSGVLEEESANSVLFGQADGNRVTFSRSEIAELKNSGLSLMPEGFEQQLSPEQMRDLVGFIANGGLASQKTNGLSTQD